MSTRTDDNRDPKKDSSRGPPPPARSAEEGGTGNRPADRRDAVSRDSRDVHTFSPVLRTSSSPSRRSVSAMPPPPVPQDIDRNTPEASSSPRPLRKRAAPLRPALDGENLHGDMSDNDEDNVGGENGGSSGGYKSARSMLSLDDPLNPSQGDFICLCTPAPKIPRPRNAFILFRQHYQSHVVADNPGLTNPEISKIIGEMWQKQPTRVKDEWKDLAEQEKARHRMQYPDYRYQPRRMGKSTLAARPGSDGAANGETDPGRCPKCGGRYIATPRTPSTPRHALGSGKLSGPPTSSFGGFTPRDNKAYPMPSPFETDQGSSRGLPSPGPQYASAYARISQREVNRRPLPQHGRPGSASAGRPDAGYIEDLPSDQKRRRYDAPPPPSAQSASGNNMFLSYRPASHQNYSNTSAPTTPASAPLPSQTPTYAHAPPSWMDLPPPPPRLPSRSNTTGFMPDPRTDQTGARLSSPFSLPPAHQQRTGDGRDYMPLTRLPPPGNAYGYLQGPPSSDSIPPPPSTAMAGLSMSSAPLPPSSVVDTQRDSTDKQQSVQSGIADDSLKLPPLQTHMLAKSQSPGRSDSGSGGGTGGSGGNSGNGSGAVPTGQAGYDKMVTDSGCDSAGSGRMQDMRAFAVSPFSADGLVDKDSQASGVRAMVMSVPYLNKLEVLRRITPPQPAVAKRGPIIAVEGHSAALIEEVGRIVEKALIQSGECAVSVWSTDKRSKGGQDEQATGSAALASYHELIMAWRKKSSEIVRHVTTRGGKQSAAVSSLDVATAVAGTATESEMAKKSVGAAVASSGEKMTTSPPAPPSPASSSSSPVPSAAASPPPPAAQSATPTESRMPVALITGGYSLSLSDHYATSVPIEDGFPPIGHWEWMATLWRGMAGPDLVVYADPKPVPKHLETAVNTCAQEGVMVVHVPPKKQDGPSNPAKLIDDKLSRRLAFEVMEWVRSAGFCEE